jgi:hypothetical protein
VSNENEIPWTVYAAGAPRDTSKVGATLQTIGPIPAAEFPHEKYVKALECDATIVRNWLARNLPSGTLNVVREKLLDKIPEGAMLVTLPYSEVCMHMQVAGKRMFVALTEGDMAQLYTLEGEKFSFPITRGEAGVSHHLPTTRG